MLDMSLESVTILTASSHYLEDPNANIPSSTVINHFLHKKLILEADVTYKNKESDMTTKA